MKVNIVTETLSNEEVAKRQVDRAISLFFDEEDYVSALTLAGAAEEILGKMLNIAGEKNILDEIIDFSLRLQGIEVLDKKSRSAVATLANRFRNILKHYNDGGWITVSISFYAAEMIDRAVKNYWRLTSQETPQMRRFKEKVLSE